MPFPSPPCPPGPDSALARAGPPELELISRDTGKAWLRGNGHTRPPEMPGVGGFGDSTNRLNELQVIILHHARYWFFISLIFSFPYQWTIRAQSKRTFQLQIAVILPAPLPEILMRGRGTGASQLKLLSLAKHLFTGASWQREPDTTDTVRIKRERAALSERGKLCIGWRKETGRRWRNGNMAR